VNNGAGVVNISAGGPGYSQAFQDTILWATRRGALVVASVGNEGNDSNPLNYPAAYRRVLGVGALCDAIPSPECPSPYGVARFSNRNRSVDVIAPGVNIVSSVPPRVGERATGPRSGYALKDGTSMAAPYVAGVAALVMASNDGLLSPYQVMRQIENTAVDLPPGGRDASSGAGIVNPRAAVTLTAPADDTGEVNDDVKWVTGTKRLKEVGRTLRLEATADRVEDPDDVYAVRLRRGERLRIVLTYGRGRLDLYLWRPGTRTVATGRGNVARNLIRYRGGASKRKVIVYRATRAGRHFVNVFARRGAADYAVDLVRGG
jgi:subtilisin family serine protease